MHTVDVVIQSGSQAELARAGSVPPGDRRTASPAQGAPGEGWPQICPEHLNDPMLLPGHPCLREAVGTGDGTALKMRYERS